LLIAAFRDPHTEEPVRAAAIEAVEVIGGAKAVESLGELVVRPEMPAERRVRAIAALGRLQVVAAIPSLLVTLKARQPAVRTAGVDALLAILETRPPAEGRRRPVR